MKYAVDLHIHSALSPCSDEEMTPNNIVNMALLKGLDIIAITDHNSAANLSAVAECAEGGNILVVPGMEIETSEEIHLVCLFPDTETALNVQDKVYAALPPIDNREDIFGRQVIMDASDNITGVEGRMLLTAASLGITEVSSLVEGAGGVVIPAHVDRDSYSVISNLGFIPEELNVNYVEISKNCNTGELLEKYPRLSEYGFIRSSDAHNLGDILERESFIELEELSIRSLLEKLKV